MNPASPRFSFVVGTTSLAFVVGQLDVTIVNVALPHIATEFSARVATLQWIVDAYTLAFAIFMLSAGALGDRFGSRRGFVMGFAVFGVASLLCGLAPDSLSLIAARALQGLGAAVMLPNSLALLNHVFFDAPTERGRAIGWWTAAGSISIAAGPVIGGLLMDTVGWRWIFFVNLPLCLAGMLLGLRLPETERHAHSHRIDWTGQILVTLALTALIAAVIEARPLGFGHPFIWGGFTLACLLGFAFLRVQQRVPEPTIPLDLFRNRTFNAAVIFGMAVNLTYYGMLFVLTLYLQRVLGYSALHAGLAFLPLTAGFFLSNVISGWVMGRFGRRLPILLGASLDAAGFLLLLSVAGASSHILLFVAFLLIPTGMGLAVPAMTTTVLASVPKQRSGTASAVLNAARQAAGAIGVAVFGSLANGDAAQTISGLREAAWVSIGLLLLAAWGIFKAPMPHVVPAKV
ncbi:MFS transporter [Silvimonas sp.]|uniref:MFS transporter n=1 Tax=Silvimonas sp. TaxID=2650811 RepID=UPI002842A9DA|nr:MFS transporter [Silvimonas sp.]MDR3429449.1 MFS transporter [Silvimonas sp.]